MISMDIITVTYVPITHLSMPFNNHNPEEMSYIFQLSIGLASIWTWGIKRREISDGIPGHSTMVPGSSAKIGTGNGKILVDQGGRRTRVDRACNQASGNARGQCCVRAIHHPRAASDTHSASLRHGRRSRWGLIWIGMFRSRYGGNLNSNPAHPYRGLFCRSWCPDVRAQSYVNRTENQDWSSANTSHYHTNRCRTAMFQTSCTSCQYGEQAKQYMLGTACC